MHHILLIAAFAAFVTAPAAASAGGSPVSLITCGAVAAYDPSALPATALIPLICSVPTGTFQTNGPSAEGGG
jgi:hypothetical protein